MFMKYFFVCVSILFSCNIFSQKHFFQTEISSVFPSSNKSIYSFSELGLDPYSGKQININRTLELEEKVLWDLELSYNYFLFNKFSIGSLTGFVSYSNPSVFSVKLGGIIRYVFIKEFQANAFLSVSGLFPLTSGFEPYVGQVKIGVNMPIALFDKFTLNLGLYNSYVSYLVTKPLISYEKPANFEHRGWGLSLGLKF